MVQEYLFTSDQYKADLENLIISPKVTKEITKFENSKCWTLLISVPGVSLDAAKILDQINRKVCENYRPIVLANECSAYFNKALYPIVNEFERKLLLFPHLAFQYGDLLFKLFLLFIPFNRLFQAFTGICLQIAPGNLADEAFIDTSHKSHTR